MHLSSLTSCRLAQHHLKLDKCDMQFTLLDLEVAAKPAYKANTAWTPMYKPGTLKVSNMISAVYSLFSGVFRGGSVKMKL